MFNIVVIEKPARTSGSLVEECCENRLTVRGIRFGWAAYEYLLGTLLDNLLIIFRAPLKYSSSNLGGSRLL